MPQRIHNFFIKNFVSFFYSRNIMRSIDVIVALVFLPVNMVQFLLTPSPSGSSVAVQNVPLVPLDDGPISLKNVVNRRKRFLSIFMLVLVISATNNNGLFMLAPFAFKILGCSSVLASKYVAFALFPFLKKVFSSSKPICDRYFSKLGIKATIILIALFENITLSLLYV